MSKSPPPVRVFIGSSAEGLDVAHNLQAVLEQRAVCEVEVWDQDVFAPSSYAVEALVGDGEYSLDYVGVFGVAQRGVAEQRVDRGQPGVAGAHAPRPWP